MAVQNICPKLTLEINFVVEHGYMNGEPRELCDQQLNFDMMSSTAQPLSLFGQMFWTAI